MKIVQKKRFDTVKGNNACSTHKVMNEVNILKALRHVSIYILPLFYYFTLILILIIGSFSECFPNPKYDKRKTWKDELN